MNRSEKTAGESPVDRLMDRFEEADVDGAAQLIQRQPNAFRHQGVTAHPILREFVARHQGRCHRRAQVQIANLLTPTDVRQMRDAVLQNDLSSIKELLAQNPKLAQAEFVVDRGISQPIHHWRHPAVGQTLLEAGAEIHALTSLGESPLTMQMRFGTIDGIKMLLESGADPNVGRGGHMPSREMEIMIPLLLAYGWNVDRECFLHDARHGHGNRIRIWLKYGADPNLRNQEGQTALHLLALSGRGHGAIRALLQAGADINSLDNAGRTPLDLARLAPTDVAYRELAANGAQHSDNLPQ